MLTIADVLDAEDLKRVHETLAEAPFVSGKTTAGPTAAKVKANQQADGSDPRVRALGDFVRRALQRSPTFIAFARPQRWSKILFSKYGVGDQYGFHTDDASMDGGDGGRIRTDLSFTLFLSDPDTYEGGALLIDGLDGEREFRPAAGSAVIYSTGQLHRVTPVTRGERVAAVGWVHSMVSRSDERELIFDLQRVRWSIAEGQPQLLLDKAIGNLLRMWGKP